MQTNRRTFLGHLALLLAAAPAAFRAGATETAERASRATAPRPAPSEPALELEKRATDYFVELRYRANYPVTMSIDGRPWVTKGNAGRVTIPRPTFGERSRSVAFRVQAESGAATMHTSSIPARASG